MGVIAPKELKLKLKNVFGESFVLENPDEIKGGEEWELSEEYLQWIQGAARMINMRQSEVLSRAVGLDDDLDDIIKHALFGNKITESSKYFESLILKTDFFSSMNKWKVFRELIKHLEYFKGDDFSDLLSPIHELINIRNRLAHGGIIFRGEKIFLSYYHGTQKEVELTPEYFDIILKKFQDTTEKLSKLSSDLSGESTTQPP